LHDKKTPCLCFADAKRLVYRYSIARFHDKYRELLPRHNILSFKSTNLINDEQFASWTYCRIWCKKAGRWLPGNRVGIYPNMGSTWPMQLATQSKN
jgi:hypothetical protein